jgi:hypothetical protein
MNRKYIIFTLGILAILIFNTAPARAENIDPDNDGSQYAYGENIGWLNFEPSQGSGVTVSDANVAGYVWAENIGWINLSPAAYGGVANDGTGFLSGYAWAETVGWINFNPTVSGNSTHYGVTIDDAGNFGGWAYGENIGWLHLRSAAPVAYKVKTSWVTSCVVDLVDLADFCTQWLDSGSGLEADLVENGSVDFADYSYLAEWWLRHCPPGWLLGQ